MLMEQLDYSLLFRWSMGLNMVDPIWDATVFTKNRQRLLAGDIADAFFAAVLKQAIVSSSDTFRQGYARTKPHTTTVPWTPDRTR
jgi:hypothetical protein